MNPINHSFFLNVEECSVPRGSVITSSWVSRFSQFLMNGPFEKQIGGSQQMLGNLLSLLHLLF